MNTTATYTTADQNWADGNTTYWFELGGETFGIVEGERNPGPVDCDGMPIDYNEHLRNTVLRECIVTDEIRNLASGL